MAGDWIKVRTSLPNDGRLRIVSRTCHATTVTALGALVTLWSFADLHADADGVLLGYTCDDLDLMVGVPGFCSALPPDWIDISGEWVKLPEYQEHNGASAKARGQATKRKRTERAVTVVPNVSRNERDTSVTREEKRREEKEIPPAVPADAPVKPSKTKNARGAELQTWIDSLPADQDAIAVDDPIFEYAASISLPPDYIELAWAWFKASMAGKRQKDWRAHFRNAVRNGWPKYWWPTDDGGWRLSPAGEQAKRALDAQA